MRPIVFILCLSLCSSLCLTLLSSPSPASPFLIWNSTAPLTVGLNGRGAAFQEDGAAGETYVFLEMLTERDAYYEQEPIRLRLHIGFDAAFFRTHAIQLFRRQLDLPLQLQANWLDDLSGTISLEGGSDPSGGAGDHEKLSFVLNDDVVQAARIEDRTVEGRLYTVLEIERRYLPTHPGDLVIPEATLRFAFATRFKESLLDGRVAEDRRDALVYGGGRTVRILPLPQAGRPVDFTGAVGRFSARAEAKPRELTLGESFKLSLRIEGDGNLGFFDPPRLDRIEGFHVYGWLEEKGKSGHTVVYDLAPLGEEVVEVPPISFSFFDTSPPAGFRTVQTRPIPLQVGPPADGVRLDLLRGVGAERSVPGETDILGIKPVSAMSLSMAPHSLSPVLLVCALLLPWLLAAGLMTWLRARERDRNDPDGVRARNAAAAFRAQAGRVDGNPAEAVAEFLGARLRCPAAAMIAPDLKARLESEGVPMDLAVRSTALLEALVNARYGAGPFTDDWSSARKLVDDLEAWFQAAGRAP